MTSPNPWHLTTAHLADAVFQLKLPLRLMPQAIRPVTPGMAMAGPVLPVRHYGSVDQFLEALETTARPGDVMVIDNAGRTDEACIGDLVALECQLAGLAGMIVHGCHRDTADLVEIGLPIFSYGPFPCGPVHWQPAPAEPITELPLPGGVTVSAADYAFADADGVLFVAQADLLQVTTLAQQLRDRERHQATQARQGTPLRTQFKFADYLKARQSNPTLTFRQHLQQLNAAIEV